LKVLCSENLILKKNPVEFSEEREASSLSMGESLKLLSPEDGNIAFLQTIGEFQRRYKTSHHTSIIFNSQLV
jgi:hypothetical protein